MTNRHSIKVISQPDVYPVTLEDLKSFLRVDGVEDDSLLQLYIQAATDALQAYCRRYFIQTELELHMDKFSVQGDLDVRLGAGVFVGHVGTFTSINSEIELPCPPIISITSVKTYDTADNESTQSNSQYRLDGTGGRLYLRNGATWPSDLRDVDAVKITYLAGYGDDSSDVPAAVRQAIMMHAGKMYECRGDCEIQDACKRLLDGYRLLDDFGWC